MSSKFFTSRVESNRGKQSNSRKSTGSRTNNKRPNTGIKKSGRGR